MRTKSTPVMKCQVFFLIITLGSNYYVAFYLSANMRKICLIAAIVINSGTIHGL